MTPKATPSKSIFLGLVLSIILTGNLLAQENETSASSEKKWSFLVEPYILFPNMKGDVGVRNLPNATIDASTNDIFGKLKMGFMINLEASNGTWAVGSDVLYMKLGTQKVRSRELINGSVVSASGELAAKQTGWELMGLRRVTPWLEVGLGGLINSISSDLELTLPTVGGGTTTNSASKTKTWFDPMIIARIKSNNVKKFNYQFRGEIGGFGIGSDLAWQIQAYAGYRFSKLFEVTGGYRIISLDYESGSGQDRFLYDVDTSGPVIRLGFNF
ncbi:hypothetical protein [Eudoraea sp.]|uniref:hypothetical protein n=1 Tax=Eudoraea sp. TaxID=1979955 RepID=UPI003C78E05F